LRPFLVMSLIVCLDIGVLFFVGRFLDLQPLQLQITVLLGALAAIIGCYTETWLAQPTPDMRERRTLSYRIAELLLLIMLTRLAVWWMMDSWPTFSDLLIQPLSTLLDGPFIFSGLITALSWVIASAMTDDLLGLGLQSEEIYAATLSPTQAYERSISRNTYIDRREILRRFTSRWVTGGIVLVLLSASARFTLAEGGFTTLFNQNINPIVVVAIIFYFLIGLLLISQGELALLRSRWTLQKIPNTPIILRNWPFYVFGLVLTIGLIAILLPLGSTFYLGQIAWTVFSFVYQLVITIFQLIAFFFMYLTSGLAGRPTSEIPAWTGGVFFWLTMTLLLGYAAYIYFSGKGFNFNWLQNLWKMLSIRWQQLWGTYRGWQQNRLELDETEERRFNLWSRQSRKEQLPWRERTPTEQLRYFYLTLLDQAAKANIGRMRSETPLQYGPRLQAEIKLRRTNSATKSDGSTYLLEEVQAVTDDRQSYLAAMHLDSVHLDKDHLDAVKELTDAFVQIHYAGDEISSTQIPRLQRLWEQLGGLFGSLRQ